MKKWNLKKALVVFKEEASHPSHREIHELSLERVCAALREQGIAFRVLKRAGLRKAIAEDFIVTVGGDGTFLHASHFAGPRHLLLGVNSVPHASHGAFCSTDAERFEKALQRLLQGKAPITPLHRLVAKKNGKRLPILALNDILIANPSPAGTSRYELVLGRLKEEQKSSGLWISTPSGSSAAIRSAGGKLLAKHSRQFQFLVREPFQQGARKLRLLKGVLPPGQTVKVRIQMSKGALFVDGCHIRYDLKQGDVAEIGLSKEILWAVMK